MGVIKRDVVNGAIQIRKKKIILFRAWRNVLVRILLLAGFVVFCFSFVMGYQEIETNDMFPAAKAGDAVLYLRVGSIINNDVVLYEAAGKENIGRVQATEGMVIGKTEGGLITIDGNFQPIQERLGLFWETKVHKDFKKYQVPEDHFFILGDERDSATDSRDFGPVPRKNIKGKVFTVIRRRNL